MADERIAAGDPAFARRLVPTATGCLEYTGARLPQGYGQVRRRALSPVPLRAHRYAWTLVHGDPGPLWVLHRCDNPPCCNPDHLFLGDAAANNADMDLKGRSRRVGRAIWTECKRGHDLTDPANRKPAGSGTIKCRICANARQRRKYRQRLTSTG